MKKDKKVDHFDMDILIGYILLAGVLISSALIAIGLIWHWVRWRNMRFEHSIVGMNFFEFIVSILT